MNGHDRNPVKEKHDEHHNRIGTGRIGACSSAAEDKARARKDPLGHAFPLGPVRHSRHEC